MSLEYEERLRIQDVFDVYDLIEILDLDIFEFIAAFEVQIESNVEVMEKIGIG